MLRFSVSSVYRSLTRSMSNKCIGVRRTQASRFAAKKKRVLSYEPSGKNGLVKCRGEDEHNGKQIAKDTVVVLLQAREKRGGSKGRYEWNYENMMVIGV